MSNADRTLCAVPHCRRSTKGVWAWWLCPDHWRLVDRSLKQLRTKLKRRLRRRGELGEDKRSYWPKSTRAQRTLGGVGRRMIRQAIERAAGLG